MINKSRNVIYLPIILSIILILGIFIGINLKSNTYRNIESNNSPNKINDLLEIVSRYYVDTIDQKKLTNLTIDAILQQLDPHSYYIPAEDLKAVNEPLNGSFEGVGIEFNIQKDTIMVISAINTGPAEKAGIMAGDRIVSINKKNVAGIKISSQQVFKSLRGNKGTTVTVGILRKGLEKPKNYVITRDVIPTHSLDASFMITPTKGYIKLSKFSATSYDEFKEASEKLLSQGMKELIFDLRGNGGGYLDAAIGICDEFLSKGKLIVYTQGKARPRNDAYASNDGILHNIKLTVLIDEFSASASEIVAGAIQDNDRGVIVGRRSFGKGLVQEQLSLPDSSAIRLTIARYYTPSGRCIQKPYNEGVEAYYNDFAKRFTDGELESADSIKKNDSLKFKTSSGRTVYGGGGIIPDIFVPVDTNGGSKYFNLLYEHNLINQFCFEWADKNRSLLKIQYKNPDNFVKTFNVDAALLEKFVVYADKYGVKSDPSGLKRSQQIIKTQIKGFIGRNIFGMDVLYRVILDIDNVFQKSLSAKSK